MALSDLQKKRVERSVEVFLEAQRPPPHLRSKLDLGYRIIGQSVELFEIRPKWKDPSQKQELSFAKATYVKSRDVWRVFWQRADLRWHGYDPNSEVRDIDEFLSVVGRDEYSCFFG